MDESESSMSQAVDYGNIEDYIFEDDDWTLVQPDGSTLVIPGQWGEGPLVATVERDTYWPIDNDCPDGNCALFAHDIFTGLYAILIIAGFNTSEEDCLCALASSFQGSEAECKAILQQIVDNTTGTPINLIFPGWILNALNPNFARDAVVAFDYWFVGCYGAVIEIPNLPVPIPPNGPPSAVCGCGYPSFR